jgi:autotransporter-associated beta strand protein
MRTTPVQPERVTALLRCTLVLGLLLSGGPAKSEEVAKANNTNALSLTSSWSGGAVPGTNDVAVWNNTVTAANSTDLGDNLSWAGIRIVNPGGLVTISNSGGSTLTLGSLGIDMSAATQSLNLALATASAVRLALGAAQTWNVATNRLITSGNLNTTGVLVTNNGHTLTIDGGGGVYIGSYEGSGGLVVKGGSSLFLRDSGLYNYSGGLTVSNSTLNIRGNFNQTDEKPLGSGALIVHDASLILTVGNPAYTHGNNVAMTGNLSISNSSVAGGARDQTFGTLSIGGSGTLSLVASGTNDASIIFGSTILDGTPTFDIGSRAGNGLQLGAIDEVGGARGIIKDGVGSLILTAAGTFSGNTTVNNGIVRLAHGSAVQNSTVDLAGLGGSVQFATNVTAAVFGGLKGNQNLALTNAANGAVALTVGGNNQSTIYGGSISGSGSLTKAGLGVFHLARTNTYTGTTTVSEGTLVVDGAIAGGDLTVASGATLGGSGTIGGNTTISGDLRPGNSPGLLTFDGNLTLTTTSRTVMEIGGTTRGEDYDAVNVGGILTYGGRLDLDFTAQGYAPNTTYTFNLFQASSYQANFASVHLVGVYGEKILDFDSINDLWTYSDGILNTWTFYVGEGKLELAVIPEPSSFALIILSGLVGAGYAVRRRCGWRTSS